MPTEFKITISGADRLLENYQARKARALQMAGAAWQSEARDYPPKASSGDVALAPRTANLAKSANFEVASDGNSANLRAPRYYAFLLFGTGLFATRGPRRRIEPRQARVLAIPTADGGVIFRKWVSGSIWDGKLQKVKEAVINGFKVGFRG